MQVKIKENAKLLTIVVPLKTNDKKIENIFTIFSSLSKEMKNLFKVYFVELNPNIKENFFKNVKNFKLNDFSWTFLDKNKAISDEYDALIEVAKQTNSIYIRMLYETDFLIKESLIVYFKILMHRFPSILYNNYMYYDDKDRILYPNKISSKKIKEGKVKEIPSYYKNNILLYTFKLVLFNNYEKIYTRNVMFKFQHLVLHLLQGTENFYSTKSYIYGLRISKNTIRSSQLVNNFKSFSYLKEILETTLKKVNPDKKLVYSYQKTLLYKCLKTSTFIYFYNNATKENLKNLKKIFKKKIPEKKSNYYFWFKYKIWYLLMIFEFKFSTSHRKTIILSLNRIKTNQINFK